jgi:carboxymethylenebutenolidase
LLPEDAMLRVVAPPPVLEAYRSAALRMPNIEFHVFPGIEHGIEMPGNPAAFDAATREFSMQRALAIVDGLRNMAPAPAS